MKQLFTLLLGLAICASVMASDGRRATVGPPANVLTGLDVLKRDGFAPLKGRNIAIITNQTGRDRDGNSIVDLLLKAEGVKIVCLFSPEHGLYGKLDEKVGHGTDENTGLRVWSLYGETRKPSDEMLKGVDTLVFDIADVGARFYTYSATLGICMEAAAKKKIAFFLLDRPNPITGLYVDGPIADKKLQGFTAYGPMPIAHGMTFGELAQLYKGAWGADKGLSDCDLHVIRMEGWKRDMWFDETGLPWVNPSPNMRNLTQALLYTCVGLLEASNVSVGRGTDQPFELFGAPYIDNLKLSASLNAAKTPGLRFVPIEFTPTSSKFKGELCKGVYVIVTDRNALNPINAGVMLLWTMVHQYEGKFEAAKVVNLLQNDAAAKATIKAKSPETIPAIWKADVEQFRKLRAKYLIYE